MKQRKKSAFTLAELLVTLSVVGIVALMAIPQLITSVQKHKNTAVLGREVQNIENGCQKLISDANSMSANAITTTITDERIVQAVKHAGEDGEYTITKDMLRLYGRYFNVEDAAVSENYKMSEYEGDESAYSGETNINEGVGANVPSVSFTRDKNTAAFVGSSATGNEAIPYLIFIDTNGQTPPNRFGRDIFMFGLDSSCHMVPAGSQKMKNFAAGSFLSAEDRESLIRDIEELNKTISLMRLNPAQLIVLNNMKRALESMLEADNQNIKNSPPYNGLDTENCQDGNITKGLTCTARIVKDGFKIKY